MSASSVEVLGHGTISATLDDSLLELCENHDIPMASACGGFAACNSCRILVISGSENLSPKLPEEEGFLDHPGHRLGCQVYVHGPTVIRLEPGM